jgi:DnaJ family protein B protein 6
VLSDSKKRAEYDLHGIWPPPEEQDDLFTSRMPGGSRPQGFPRAHPSSSRNRTFPDPFAFHHNTFRGFQFTDPYDLFNSLFENTFHAHSRPRHASYPQMGPFDHIQRMQAEIETFMDDIDRDPFTQLGGFPRTMMSNPMMQMPMPMSLPSGGRDRHGRQWISDSYVTSTVNGVTQTIHKRVDSEGNEHISRTLPDGQKVRTINGIEQPSVTGYLPSSKNRRTSPVESSGGYRYLPPTSNPPVSAARMDYDYDYEYGTPPMQSNLTPPPSYHEHTPPMDNSGYRRTRRSSDKYVYTSQSPNPDSLSHEDRHHHKKRWWQQ